MSACRIESKTEEDIVRRKPSANPEGPARTIYDIAAVAGVSANTVSKVLNNKPGVGLATRERILEIIRELNFRPHIAARGLRAKQNACIGVTVSAPTDVAPVSQGLLLWLFTEMYRIFGGQGEYICFDMKPFTSVDPVDYARGVFEHLFKACVISGPLALNDTRIRQIHETNVPYVTLGRLDSFPECSSATVDFRKGAHMSAQFLIHRGHKQIAMLKAFRNYQPGLERRQGYTRALEEAGLDVHESMIQAVKFGAQNVADRVHRLLVNPDITALIDCSATEDGAALREGIRRAGREVGKDLEVVVWTYDAHAAVLPEAAAHVWLPVREAAGEGIELLADWTYGRRSEPIRLLYQPVLDTTPRTTLIAKPRRLFTPLE